MNPNDVLAALPLGVLTAVTMTMLLLDLFGLCTSRLLWGLSACFLAWVFSCTQFYISEVGFSGLVFVDGYTTVLSTLILAGTALSLLLSHKYLGLQRAQTSIDVDVLILLAAAGGLVMVAAAHLIVIFIGFELLSVCVYVLTGIARKERASAEGALKYFLLGAFSSAFLLYGMALVYGATGTMFIEEIGQVGGPDNVLLLIGIGLLIFGFGFKVSLVPFHLWTPDVYQGAPVSVTTFMAVVVKTAAFGTFLRLMYVAFGGMTEWWEGLIWTLCVLTMTVGNLAALRQSSVKRMLAYSSIAHAGYALMGFLALGPAGGAEATVFYLLAYGLMTVASFGVVLVATAGSDAQYGNDDISSLSGLGFSHPFLGVVMTVSMLSLAGMPPLAGFMGKLYLFSAAINSGFVGLAVIAALNSVVSLYYYLRVLVVMYFSGERTLSWAPPRGLEWAPKASLGLVTVGTVFFGLFSYLCYPAIEVAIKSLG
ncbi:MAG: NADH-quinone oxidoreductase subunit N [Bdellovibrionales bacterium]|nr:NADH-quinone oxidoreductase subunit N [Bdellovibrionales bacterium]